GFHVTPKLHLICPESCILIVIGVVIGLLLFYTGLTSVGPLTPDVFFLFMLPPIVLDAGYYMPNRSFFDNLGSIMTYAVLGTVWNTLTIGLCLWGVGLTGLYGTEVPLLDALLFSSIISAVDPVAVLAVFEEIHVNDVLYILVFGESLLNDAVTVVTIHRGLLSLTAISIHCVNVNKLSSNLLSFRKPADNHCALFLLIFSLIKQDASFLHVINVSHFLFTSLSGSPLLLAYVCSLYASRRFSTASFTSPSHQLLGLRLRFPLPFFCTFASAMSNCLNILLMIINFILENILQGIHQYLSGTSTSTMLLVFIIPALARVGHFVLEVCFAPKQAGALRRNEIRGIVSALQVLLLRSAPVHAEKRTRRSYLAAIKHNSSCFFQGMTIGPLVRLLNVPQSVKGQMSMNERLHTRLMDHLMAGLEDVTGQFMGNYKIRDKFKYYNNKFLRPMLLKDHSIREPKIIETYSKLNLADAMNLMKNNNSLVPVMTNENGLSLASLFRTYTQTNLSKSNTAAEPTLGELDLPMDRTATVLNFDMNELQYSPSNKDYADAQLHHILSDSMFKPSRRVKRLSRDRIDGAEDQPAFHHHMRMQIRTFLGEERRRMRKARSSRNPQQQQQHHHHSGHAEDPPVPCRHQQEAGRKIPNGGEQKRWPRTFSRTDHFMTDKTKPQRIGRTYTDRTDRHVSCRQIEHAWPEVAMETPETRAQRARSPRAYSPPPPRPESLTETETTLPWKRDDVPDAAGVRARCGSGDGGVRQREFPSWIDNRDYISYQSPTSTILGRLDRHKRATPDIFELFQLKPGMNPIATMEEVREEDHRDGDSLNPESPLAQLPAGPSDECHEGGPSSTTSTEPLPPTSTWEETVIDLDSDDSDSSPMQVRL
ncbi:unnamed protein product, partial [Ixodes hexagonus]